MKAFDGWDAWLAIFFVLTLAVYGLHEWYCWRHPQRRARNHWKRGGYEQHKSYFSDCKRMYPDEY